MADQDFNIKVVTTADTTGIKQTSSELDKLKTQQATFAETARRQAAAAQAASTAKVTQADSADGITGTAIGLGTIVTLLTAGVRQWKLFNAEQDRMVDNMIKSAEKARELGESILEMQDKARNAARVGVEPLYQSFIRLQQEIIRLKTEQSLLNLPEQGEEWKKLNAEVNTDAALLRGVTSELQKQTKEREKAAEAKARSEESFIKGAVETTGPQVQAALRNEEAARRASAAGDERSAEQFRRSSEQIQRGMTGAQSDEFNQLKAEMARMNVSLQMILEQFR